VKYTDPDGNTPINATLGNAINLDFGRDYAALAQANFAEGEYGTAAIMVADAIFEAAYDGLIAYGTAYGGSKLAGAAISGGAGVLSGAWDKIKSFFGNIGYSNAVQKMMASATSQFHNGPLTKVGHALTKHPNVIGESGNILNKLGGAEGVNKAGAEALSSIVSNGTRVVKNTAAFGKVIEYKLENGIGARFYEASKEFIGFLGRGVK
jgi:hypothetical protein